jgi:myo-inositol-1(or 4)-monophosphatase
MGRITGGFYGSSGKVDPYSVVMHDIDFAMDLARAAGKVVQDWSLAAGDTHFKGAVDPVTAADRAAERLMIEMIERGRPADGVVGEEGGLRTGERTWILDPIDGTVNFLHGIPHVAVSVGLIDGDGPLVGVVLDVFKREMFTAVRGGGSELDGSAISVSRATDLSASLVATGFPYDRQERADEYGRAVAAGLHNCQGLRRNGSAALDLAWVAVGRFDAYWEFQVQPWDMAAGVLLITEAGGSVTDVHGQPIDVTQRSSILASNQHIHQPVLDMLEPVIPTGY